MATFYNQGDKAIYDSGQYYIPQEQYRLNYTAPPIIEEEEQESIGIPNTNSFKNFSNSDNRNFSNNSFQPYTAQPSGSFVTNRTDYGSSGYLPGTEPEETFMDKAGSLIGRGIASFIPGGNFLMSLAQNQSRENRLSPTENAFIDMQLANKETPYHGMGNLSGQDYYGYNKDSMFGNYANLVSELAAKAAAKNPEDLTDFDKYYLQKQEEEDDIKNQIDFNNFINQRITANNIRDRIKNDPTYDEKFNIHTDGGNTITPPTIITPTNLNDYSGGGGGHAGGQAAAEAAASQAADDVAAGAGGYKRGGLASL